MQLKEKQKKKIDIDFLSCFRTIFSRKAAENPAMAKQNANIFTCEVQIFWLYLTVSQVIKWSWKKSLFRCPKYCIFVLHNKKLVRGYIRMNYVITLLILYGFLAFLSSCFFNCQSYKSNSIILLLFLILEFQYIPSTYLQYLVETTVILWVFSEFTGTQISQ